MIPRHRPPFGVGRVLLSMLDWSRGADIVRIEDYFAEDEYLNASRVASEVFNLPPDPHLGYGFVDRVCEELTRGVKHLRESSNRPPERRYVKMAWGMALWVCDFHAVVSPAGRGETSSCCTACRGSDGLWRLAENPSSVGLQS